MNVKPLLRRMLNMFVISTSLDLMIKCSSFVVKLVVYVLDEDLLVGDDVIYFVIINNGRLILN